MASPGGGARIMKESKKLDEEELAQYYSNMTYPMGSSPMMSQYPTAMPGSTGYAPTGSLTSYGYQTAQYQNPYTMSPDSAAPMQDYQQLMTSPPPSYPGYMSETTYQSSLDYPRAQGDVLNHPDNYRLMNYTLNRPTSPTETNDLQEYGIQDPSSGTWRCRHPGCTSKAVFTRACDLRKHFNRHMKYLFCRYEGCPQATEGGFSSKKDRDRHEAKHNPQIPCEREDCDRVFSRMDNMKDHVRRIHGKRSR
ncbi:C2H2 transcription factor, putative [Talaromyces stipitatus ATCC 10500]|uniref:C2H2 transcription factor, putative n=1 Tax=Talaromyces stipitatus (strain ATCC 10500 / CBS 375.48 / QM 6759 / NRRL 1006) TaxID=441959 RepID=B8MHE3_TALSN|nr:C2H2 transcription factor, putative [Talaromyces stipitatus ATCC 10500]EED17122.1 C2H2 transcription factor, putative [Talaromyces stipitatus ATCC 10500]